MSENEQNQARKLTTASEVALQEIRRLNRDGRTDGAGRLSIATTNICINSTVIKLT